MHYGIHHLDVSDNHIFTISTTAFKSPFLNKGLSLARSLGLLYRAFQTVYTGFVSSFPYVLSAVPLLPLSPLTPTVFHILISSQNMIWQRLVPKTQRTGHNLRHHKKRHHRVNQMLFPKITRHKSSTNIDISAANFLSSLTVAKAVHFISFFPRYASCRRFFICWRAISDGITG